MSLTIVQKLWNGVITVAENMKEEPGLSQTMHRVHDKPGVAFFIVAIRKDELGQIPGEPDGH